MHGFKKRLLSFSAAAAMAVSAVPFTALPTVSAATDISGYTALDITQHMGMGFNFGNTLDATGGSGLGSETSWGNIKITKAQIDAVKAKGFSSVRLPVTWYNHLDSNYNINAAWMARVKEVVDWCIEDDMYVILNTHHESWNAPLASNYTAASTELKAIWTQIAAEFKDYDKHLVFEGLNEPRNYGASNEWNGYTDSTMTDTLNKLNKDFVDTVRATGGNNADRGLMVPTYAASMASQAMAALEIPNDDPNVIVSIHAYTPYNFTMNENTSQGATSTFSDSIQNELTAFFNDVSNQFVSRRIPVVIGEFSASNKDNLAERVKWAKSYAAQAKTLGIPCFLWDNNVPDNKNDGEAHGYFNRSSLSWYSQSESVVSTLISTYNSTAMELPEEVSVPDLTNLKTLFSGSSAISGYTPTAAIKFDASTMADNGVIAVTYTGSAQPTLCVQDTNSYQVWAKVSPYIVENGVAYFKKSDIAASYDPAYTSNYGSLPSSLYKAGQLFISAEGGSLTVKSVVYGEIAENTKTELTSAMVTMSKTSYTYGESGIPTYTVKDGTKTLVKGTDYTVSGESTAVGTHTLTFKGTGDYTGSVTKSYTVAAIKLTDSNVTFGSTSLVYSGSAQQPTVTVTVNGKNLTKGTDYTVTGSGTNVGSYTVKVSGSGNYTGDVSKSFTITEKALTSSMITMTKTAYTYGESGIPTYTVKDGSKTLTKGTDYTVSGENTNAGSYTLTFSGKGNYKGDVTKSYTVAAAEIKSSDVTLSAASFVYDAAEKSPVVTVTVNGKKLTQGTDYTVEGGSGTRAGDYTLTVKGKGNYTGEVQKSFTIVMELIDIGTCNAVIDSDLVYTGEALTPDIKVTNGSVELVNGTDYTAEFTNNTNAGDSAKAVITGTGSYKGTKEITFTIKPRAIDRSMLLNTIEDKVPYTGNAYTPTVGLSDGKILILDTDYTLEYKDNVNIGTARIVYTGQGNYTGTIEQTFEITGKKGDVNLDGKINTQDAMLSVAYAKKTQSPKDSNRFWAADMNDDGKLDTKDSMKIIALAKKQG